MNDDVEELAVPDRVTGHEVIRVFVNEGDDKYVFVTETTLRCDSPPEAWGILLADLAQHAAKSLAEAVETGRLVPADEGADCSEESILAKIRLVLDEEWGKSEVRRLVDG